MLRIVGDVNLSDSFFDTGFGVGSSIKKGADPFSKLNKSEDDFWIGNFESVCANSSNKNGSHAKQFIISPKNFTHFKHLDLYGVANNHVMQHGEKAYLEMLKYFNDINIQYVGSCDKKSTVFTHQDKKVGILAFSQRPDNFTNKPLYWSLPEYEDIKKELIKLSDCEFKIVYVHWGNEFINYPYLDQKAFAHYMIDIGADLIIGTHPHVLQGFEVYKGRHIFYSLGNCIFNMAWEPTKYSIVLNVDLLSEPKVSYEYLKIEYDYFPKIVKDVPKNYRMENLNKLISNANENEVYYKQVFAKTKEYKKANQKDIARHIYKLNFTDMTTMIGDFVKRKFK